MTKKEETSLKVKATKSPLASESYHDGMPIMKFDCSEAKVATLSSISWHLLAPLLLPAAASCLLFGTTCYLLPAPYALCSLLHNACATFIPPGCSSHSQATCAREARFLAPSRPHITP